MQNSIMNDTLFAITGLCLFLIPFAWLYWYLSLGPESEILKKHLGRKSKQPA